MNLIQSAKNAVLGLTLAVYNRLTNPNRRLVRVFGRGHIGGVWLTHEEAIRMSAVWACVCVISKAIASSTWDIFLEKANGDREYQPNSRLHYLMNVRPNREMTPIAFHETTLAVALLWGNSYAEIERDIMNRPIALWPLEPWRCWLERGYWDDKGNFLYDMTGELALRVQNYDRPDSFLHYEDVYHVHGLGLDGNSGLDLVGLAERSFLQTLAAERFAMKFYEHGTSMGGVLSSEKDLDETKLGAIRKNVQDRVAGVDNAFEFLVLGGGLKFQPLAGTLHDGQFNDTRYFLIEEACRWFGVPPHKIAHLLHATFSNIEHQGIDFDRDGLVPWKRRCEQEADYKLLPVGPVSVRINTDWVAEGDSKTKSETDSILVQNGLMTRNQVSKIRGRNSLGAGGDVLTIQSNMATLDNIIKAPPPGSQPKQIGPGGNDPNNDPNNPDDTPADTKKVVKSLVVLALRRTLKRQLNRANAAAAGAVKDAKNFERRLDATANAQVLYTHSQLVEVQNTCNDLGIFVNLDALNFAKKACSDERAMLMTAYGQGRIAGFCDIEQRANVLAEALSADAY